MLTRARGKGTGEDSDGIVVRAGLGSAITDTISVVGLGAETFIVAGRAAQLASLGFHVAEAHLLRNGESVKGDFDVVSGQLNNVLRTGRRTWQHSPCWQPTAKEETQRPS